MKNFLKLAMVIILLFALGNMQAQVKFGPKAGLNLSRTTMKSMGLSVDPKFRPGFHAGVIADVPLVGNLSLQPGLLFSTKGSNYDVDVFDFSMSPSFLEIPVNLAYSLGMDELKVVLFAGPYAAYGIAGKMEFDGESEDISFGSSGDDDMKPLDFGLNFGVGLNISNFLISAQYGMGLANVGTDEDEAEIEMKNSVIGISVAYLFGGD
jgi:hypothetical protein